MFFFVLFFYIKILGKFCHNFMITYVPTVDVKRSSWSVIALNPSYLILRSIHSGILSVLLGQCDCVQSQGSHSDMDLTFSSMCFGVSSLTTGRGGYTYPCHAACSHACSPNASGLFVQFCTFPLGEYLMSTQHLYSLV